MKATAYVCMASQEETNWYYSADRRAIETLLARYVLRDCPRPSIVDIGCGTGGTTAWLARFGDVVGIEPAPLANDLLRAKFPWLEVLRGSIHDLPTLVPEESVDLVSLLGVLYHRDVRDPLAALRAAVAAVRPGGFILWGDCVYPCLARRHDQLVESGGRFYPAEMHRLLRDCNCDIEYSSHFLGWGFPIVLALGMLHRLSPSAGASRAGADQPLESTDERPLPKWLNSVLGWWTYWEWRVGLWGLKLPLGVSRLILARKGSLPGSKAKWQENTDQRSSPFMEREPAVSTFKNLSENPDCTTVAVDERSEPTALAGRGVAALRHQPPVPG